MGSRLLRSLKEASHALEKAKGEVLHLESLAEALSHSSRLQKLMDDFEAQRDANPAWRITSPCLRFSKVKKDDAVCRTLFGVFMGKQMQAFFDLVNCHGLLDARVHFQSL